MLHKQHSLSVVLSARGFHILEPLVREAWRTEEDFGKGDPFVIAELQNLENLIMSTIQHALAGEP